MQNFHNVTHRSSSSPARGGATRRRLLVGLVGGGWGAARAIATQRQAPAAPVRVAAASDLKFALAEIVAKYSAQAGNQIQINLGSSGNFATQIRHGLPVDLYMSADENFIVQLADAGLTRDRGVLYAFGRVALFAPSGASVPVDGQLRGVRDAWANVTRFAIANPEHAPYGRAAQQVLQRLRLWEVVKPKLVLAENIAQATQFLTTGAAQVGITALSLALAPEVARFGRHAVLSDDLHAPLRQRMVLLRSAGRAATDFYDYLQSPPARAVLRRHGFSTP